MINWDEVLEHSKDVAIEVIESSIKRIESKTKKSDGWNPSYFFTIAPFFLLFFLMIIILIIRFGVEQVPIRFPFIIYQKSTARYIGSCETARDEEEDIDNMEYIDKQLEYASESFEF